LAGIYADKRIGSLGTGIRRVKVDTEYALRISYNDLKESFAANGSRCRKGVSKCRTQKFLKLSSILRCRWRPLHLTKLKQPTAVGGSKATGTGRISRRDALLRKALANCCMNFLFGTGSAW
jgi:hypothetical protein